MKTQIPDAYLDLASGPRVAALTTVMPDGQPHSSLVWCDYDGGCARVNTTRQREKGRNMLANPKVSLLVVDPENTARYLEIRGEVELIEDGALDHLDQLTRHYTLHPRRIASRTICLWTLHRFSASAGTPPGTKNAKHLVPTREQPN